MSESFSKCRIHTVIGGGTVQHLSAEPRTAGMLHSLSAGRQPAPASAWYLVLSGHQEGNETILFQCHTLDFQKRGSFSMGNAEVKAGIPYVTSRRISAAGGKSAPVCSHSSAAALGACASMLISNAVESAAPFPRQSNRIWFCGWGSCRQPDTPCSRQSATPDSGQCF